MKPPLLALWLTLASAGGEEVLLETFADDPVAAARAVVTGEAGRFAYDAGADQLTASYDLLEPHARIAWPLARALTEHDSFTATVEFSLADVDFDDFNLCQISLGFINQANTGPRRTSSPGDSWECLCIDYFPGASYPTYTPTFIGRDDDSGDALTSSSLKFPSGTTSLINDIGEIGTLPTGTTLTTTLSYDAADGTITVSLAGPGGGLDINLVGADPDSDPSTIQLSLGDAPPFAFDAFALLLWDHSQGGSAELIVSRIQIEATPRDLIAAAFPDGPPDPQLVDGQLTLTYLRDLDRDDIGVAVEHSADLEAWSEAPHSVLSSGPGYEIRRVAVPDGFLRFKITST